MDKKRWLRFYLDGGAWIVENNKKDYLGYIQMYRNKIRFNVDNVSVFCPMWWYAGCLIELVEFMRSRQCWNGLTQHNTDYGK